jgi:hypothetical protein
LRKQAESLKKILQESSDKIKAIENVLMEANLNFPFELAVKSEIEDGISTTWSVSWDIDSESRKYRLLATCEKRDIRTNEIDISKSYTKPLITTKAEIRMFYGQYLNRFVLAITSFFVQQENLIKGDSKQEDYY